MKTLLLTLLYPSRASYYDDWVDAFRRSEDFAVEVVNILDRDGRDRAARLAAKVDLVVTLHAATADTLDYVRPLTAALAARRGRLVTFVGNELNLPWARLADKIEWLRAVAPDLIATQLLEETGRYLYAEVGAPVASIPHALNPNAFRALTPAESRPVDIGARSFRYSAYLGDDDRNRLYDHFAQPREGWVLDFSQEHRFDRAGWAAFLDNCRATIATEAGSWFLERDDATVLAIRAFLAARERGLTFGADGWLHRLARRLPFALKRRLRPLLARGPVRHEAIAAERIDFDLVHEHFFAARPRPPVYGKCISSRHFDAIGTRTLQIMFEGRFNDILVAGEHYLVVRPDLSNADEVRAALRDPRTHDRLTAAALDHVMAGHTYADRLRTLAALVG